MDNRGVRFVLSPRAVSHRRTDRGDYSGWPLRYTMGPLLNQRDGERSHRPVGCRWMDETEVSSRCWRFHGRVSPFCLELVVSG